MSRPASLADLQTPCLVLDEAVMMANVARLDQRLQRLGVAARPHLKTVKSLEAARRVVGTGRSATVSTLREAEEFAAMGLTDILYAVGITPDKLARVLALRGRGCDVSVILDSPEQALAVAAASRAAGDRIPVMIEIDCDGHRAGLKPGDPLIVEIGRILEGEGASLRGVMTHSGGSYAARGAAELVAFAERERDAVVAAAEALRSAGMACPVVSVGSSPTAHFAADLAGVTEVRAGVYVFFDLVMMGIGVCTAQDVAISVLASVIGHQRERGWTLVDAGWMAMSRDLGTAGQAIDQGYGLVCDDDGKVIDDLIVIGANQEHGIVARRPGSTLPPPELPLGTRLRILPVHACATAAQFDGYEVLPAGGGALDHWPRFRGW